MADDVVDDVIGDDMEQQVAARLEGLVRLFDELRQMRDHVNSGLATIAAQLGGLEELEPRFQVRAQAIRDFTAPLVEQARAASAAALTTLQPSVQELETLLIGVAQTLSRVEGGLDDVETRANETVANIHATTDQWVAQRQEMFEQIEQTVDELVSAMGEQRDALEDGLDAFEGETTETVEAAVATITGVVDDLEERLLTPLRDVRETVDTTLTALEERVIEQAIPEAIEDVSEEVMSSLRAALDESIETLGGSLDEFVAKVLGRTEEGTGSRAALEPALAELRATVDPLFGELDRVRGLASTVGIPI
jgi:hypothetical protein